MQLLENEYLIVESDGGSTILYCYEHGQLRKFTGPSIKTVRDDTPVNIYNDSSDVSEEHKSHKSTKTKQPTKKFSKGKSVILTPRNAEQACAFDLMKDPDKTIKLLTGT